MGEVDEIYALAARQMQEGKLDDAETAARQFLAANPVHPPGWQLLGLILAKAGRLKESADALRRATQLWPEFAHGHFNLGVVLGQLGETQESIAASLRAVELQPQSASFQNHLGNALMRAGNLDDATVCYQRAVGMKPDYAAAHNNLGLISDARGMPDGALAEYQRALAIEPELAGAWGNLAATQLSLGRQNEALEAFDKAIAAGANNPAFQSGRIFTLQHDPAIWPFKLLHEAQHFGELHELQTLAKPLENQKSLDRKLRLGYLSADFREHPVGRSMLPILEHHRRASFGIACYSATERPDDMTRRLSSLTEAWRDISSLSDEAAADLIRADGIDILVDLTGHAPGNRIGVIIRQPAPIQIVYLGFTSPLGLECVQWRVSDRWIDDAKTAVYYTEKTLRMPETWRCYVPPASPDVQTPPAAQGHITCGCLGDFARFSSAAQNAWIEIMKKVENSRLLLRAPMSVARLDLKMKFASAGIDSSRIEFLPTHSSEKAIEDYHRIDIALDTFPVGSWTAACDAIWMGVPVITLDGQTAAGRVGKSALSNVGLGELIAADVDQYVSLAVNLAGDLPRLEKLRGELRGRMARSTLMNTELFIMGLESLYRIAWERWCKGL